MKLALPLVSTLATLAVATPQGNPNGGQLAAVGAAVNDAVTLAQQLELDTTQLTDLLTQPNAGAALAKRQGVNDALLDALRGLEQLSQDTSALTAKLEDASGMLDTAGAAGA